MGYYINFREQDAFLRSRKHFDTLEEATNFVLTTVKEHEDFYKKCKNLDSGCFDIHPDFEYGKDSKIIRYIATKDHYQNPKKIEMNEELVDSFIYRGVGINIYEDDYGQCYYFRCMLNNELREESCGGWNPDYKTAATDAVDYMLDKGC